jgi:hypothetical protein
MSSRRRGSFERTTPESRLGKQTMNMQPVKTENSGADSCKTVVPELNNCLKTSANDGVVRKPNV